MSTSTVLAVPVDPKLARKLTTVADRHRADEAERDRLVVEAVQAGGSLREVAALIGLSHVAVMKIVRRSK